MSKSCCSRVRGLMPLRRRCQASWPPPAARRRELDASWAFSQATSAGEVVTGAGEAVVVVVVTVVVVWVAGGEQAQRCPEAAEEEGRLGVDREVGISSCALLPGLVPPSPTD
jgi:hypothetical protein